MARIALMVDKVLRDLGGLVLLARALAQQGAEVYLVPVSRSQELFAIAPDIVLLHGLRPFSDDLYPKLQACNLSFAVLDTEGGILPSTNFYGSLLTKNQAALASMKRMYTWGPAMAHYLVEEASLFRDDQIEITGTPRYDFYANPWKQAVMMLADQDTQINNKYILINSNFTYANPSTNKDVAIQETKLFSFQTDILFQARDFGQVALHGMVEIANRLAENFPETMVVYRPHPMESLETYKALLSDLPNLKLIRDGSVESWILRSSAVIQRSCSTAFEAVISGIPSLSPRWLPAIEQPTAEAVSIPCETLDELIHYAEKAVKGELSLPAEVVGAKDSLVTDWFYSIDGNAHRRIAESLLTLGESVQGQVDTNACIENLYSLNSTHLVPSILNRTRRFLGLSPQWSFKQLRDRSATLTGTKFGAPERFFNATMVQKWIDVLSRADPTARPVRAVPMQRKQQLAPGHCWSVMVSCQ